jgi:hypothetical protein
LWYDFSNVSTELRLLLIVIIAAGLGSYIHATTSFATYIGNKAFEMSWFWWYVLRGPIGIALAIMFYAVVRGGLLSSGAIGTDVSPFGVAALASLVGMFSKQATDKLQETADSLFRTAPGVGDDARGGKLTPGPSIVSLDPAEAVAGAQNAVVSITGKNFAATSIVVVNGAVHKSEFVSATVLKVHLDATDLKSAGAFPIVVKEPAPSTRQSDPATFTVKPAPPQ